KEIGYDGWRLDYVHGFLGGYVREYMEASEPYFSVGEYWDSLGYIYGGMDHNQDAHRQMIINRINDSNGTTRVFDVITEEILHSGKAPGVVGWWPSRVVNFIKKHDTGSTQALTYLLRDWKINGRVGCFCRGLQGCTVPRGGRLYKHAVLKMPILPTPPKVNVNLNAVVNSNAKPLAIKWIYLWVRGHKCPGKFLLLMVDDGDDVGHDRDVVGADTVESGDISILNSLIEHGIPRSLQLWGTIGTGDVHVLIDNGSMHNFIAGRIA
ncbi:alpha-amylase 3, chloroplastic-like protein, partial [Tanacetum coccineum]